MVTDDSGSPIWNLFNTGNYFPSTVFIDHTMTVYYQDSGWSSTYAITKVDEMLDNLENSLILAVADNISIVNGDDDNILNPGEEFELIFTVSNNSFYIDANNVQASVSNSSNIIFDVDNFNFGNISVDESSTFVLNGIVSNNSILGNNSFNMNITSTYIDNSGNEQTEEIAYNFEINVSLNQQGFPFDANSEIKPSPLVIDFLNNNQNQILFGDNNGLIHIVDSNGEEVINNIFPFDTGNQIWGSFASGYINDDDDIDIAVVSKSKHLYVLDSDNLILDYDANKFLIGTPALGNMDSDEDLEIVFGSFSSSPKLFAVNIDGTDVEGFPLDLSKSQKGPALADFNNNNKDDIVIGTEDDEVFLIYDDASIAPGFPFIATNKIRSAPSIVNYNDSLIIIACSVDGVVYGIEDDGTLRFSFIADDDIYTSPSFLESNDGLMIFFGTENGTLYAININGQLYEGYPMGSNDGYQFGPIVGSIVFDDLDNDGLSEIVFGSESGKMNVLKSLNSIYSELVFYDSFPSSNTFGYASSPIISNVDQDDDLEIIAGTTGDVIVYDIKESSNGSDYWNIYRGNNHRAGFYEYTMQCVPGDINFDTVINILDIVTLVNVVVNLSDISGDEFCAADLNLDSTINILDIVTLVNIIISSDV
tara:strand:- start:20589 stop:22532 length:1944 start_codon:yes stop_codon:yes gene_type:complete